MSSITTELERKVISFCEYFLFLPKEKKKWRENQVHLQMFENMKYMITFGWYNCFVAFISLH